jgi:tRNA(fMet)-specific endonuclease VapC
MALYALDKDILSLFREGHIEVSRRAALCKPGELITTAITVEEHLTGWYALVRNSKQPARLEMAYYSLIRATVFFSRLPIRNFSQAAMTRFDAILKLKLNVKKNDLRIAAIALEAGAVVVTRNVRDFGRVPGLTVEDWTRP